MSITAMNRKVTDPALNKFLLVIDSSVKKFRSLINGIANIAKLESDMITMELVDILYNLISNSIKFKSEEMPLITICTTKEKKKVILSVQDNGIGIHQGDLDKIFDMYGRLHHDVEGHGIGLYLAKKIVEAASGNIIEESSPGKGSKFIIHFKAERESVVAV